MSIEIDVYSMTDWTGRVCSVEVKSTILYSPREGYDPDKIESLEYSLAPFIAARLNEALKKGGAA